MNFGRRKALLLALGGAAALRMKSLGAAAPEGESTPAASVSRTSWALGTTVSLTVAGLTKARAEAALDAAFAEIETVEQVMSLYRPGSQLCELNRTGLLRDPHPYLVQVLRTAAATSRDTRGAFDVTVQPLWELCAAAKKQGRQPTGAEIAAAKARVDWRAVETRDELVRLHGRGRAITLNGLAQGFAADRAVAALAAHGVNHALVNAGEIGTSGRKTDGENWTVGIQHPREPDAFVSLAGLSGRSLSTSGDYETTFTDDFSRHHIFDPRSGDSPAELASVSIVARAALEADALSTAAMVLGVDETLRLVAGRPGVDALLVTKGGRVLATPGFPQVEQGSSAHG
jgi:thiamine biosynthesis lipoprotein